MSAFFGHNIARGSGGGDDGMNPKPNKKLSLEAESYGTIAWKSFFTQSQVLLSSIADGYVLLTYRLRVVPHFSSGIVQRAKRERAWKSSHARKGDTRRGERKMRNYGQSPSFWTNALLSQSKTLIGSSMEICQHLSKRRQPLSTLDIITIYRTNN